MRHRIIVWFSCGAASAVAAKMALKKYADELAFDVRLVYCEMRGEHPDNLRFLGDVENWLGVSVERMSSEKYYDHFDVFEKTHYLTGIQGARCTVELKKVPRFAYQQADDIQIFGYTAEEKSRVERFKRSFPEVQTDMILFENGITKAECLGAIQQAGIELPAMYKLGYEHNNCIGCVKGGMGYWNKIRKDFPQAFERMAAIEKEIGYTLFDVPLSELDPQRGKFQDEQPISCDFVCQEIVK